MSYSSAYCTRCEMTPCKNLKPDNIHLVALDIGYSAVKGFCPEGRFCFPSYVRAQTGVLIGEPNPTEIYYRGEDGIVYAVGAVAQSSLSAKDTNDAANTLFGRNR